MMKGEVLEENPTTMVDVKLALQSIKKQEKELNFRAQKTLDYLEQAVSMDSTDKEKLVEALQKLEIPRLRDQHINKLVDILPKTQQDVKVTLQGYAITVTKENMDKIAKTISDAL